MADEKKYTSVEEFLKALDESIAKSREETKKEREEAYEKAKKEREEAHEKTMKEIAEIRKNSEKEIAEIRAIQKENAKHIGGVDRSLGHITEKMIYNTLEKNMIFVGIEFDDIQANLHRRSKLHNNLEAGYDIFLKNGDILAIIETKQKVEKKHIIELFGKKLNNFKTLFSEYKDYKIVLGIGGMYFDKEALDEANENGIGLIKVSGDNVEFHTDRIKMY